MNTNKAQVLVVVSPDKKIAIEEGYYPELEDHNGVEYITFEDLNNAAIHPGGERKAGQWYAYNKYTDKYHPVVVTDTYNGLIDLEAQLLVEKAMALQEIFIDMGAKHIDFKIKADDQSATKIEVDASGKATITSAELQTCIERNNKLSREIALKYDNNKNKPHSLKDVSERIINKNLQEETLLRHWFETFARDKHLTGKREINIGVQEEVQTLVDIASKIKLITISGDLAAKYNAIKSRSIVYELTVNFNSNMRFPFRLRGSSSYL